MISSEEACNLPRARLSEAEANIFHFAETKITAAIRDNFQGQPFAFPIPLSDVPPRVVYALKRRFEKPDAKDGSRWLVVVKESDDGSVVTMTFEPAPPSDFMPEKFAKAAPASTVSKSSGNLLADLFDELASLRGINVDESQQALSLAPDLSVILGTYNRIEHVKGAVRSVRKSVGDLSYEIVVCDGGSTDGSREWLASQRDVILIGDRHLTGAVVAFNHCYRLSRGRHIANLNDDCVVEGRALAEGVAHLDAHPEVGQVAFSFKGEGEAYHINDIYPQKDYRKVTWPTTYANFGITRREVADKVAAITGGFWNPVYKTYAADCELSAWVHKLGYKVVKMDTCRVLDTREEDGLRVKNSKDSGLEAKRMYARWPAEAFQPSGPDPRVSAEELERFYRVRDGVGIDAFLAAAGGGVSIVAPPDMPATVAGLVGWPSSEREGVLAKIGRAVRALDPVDGQFPKRAERLGDERVLHVSLCTDADPQAGLVRALKKMGSGGYREVRWFADYGQDHVARQQAIINAAYESRPTFIFMQLQAPYAVDVETVRQLRRSDSKVVIATWSGDVGDVNGPYQCDWQVPLAREVDVTLHSSLTHVRALRASGIHNAGFLNIGYDEDDYLPPTAPREKKFDVCFLGSRYGDGDAFSRSLRRHDAALRDEVVAKMREAFGDRFGLCGRGWSKITGRADRVVPLAEAHAVYWCSRIGLSVSLDNNLEMYSSDRLHRVLGCGTLALVKSFPGMSSWGLVHGENCLTWDTPEGAVALVVNATGGTLGCEVEKIAAAGAKLARDHHTWDVRCLELTSIIEAVRSAR